MKETYKDCQIEYREQSEVFTAKIGQSSYENKSLSAVKKYLDNLERKDFERVDVIIERWDKYEYGTVTSCVEEIDYDRKIVCWISLKNGSRMKKNIDYVYLDNKKNREILDSIIGKEQEIKDIKTEIGNLQSSFEKYRYEIK